MARIDRPRTSRLPARTTAAETGATTGAGAANDAASSGATAAADVSTDAAATFEDGGQAEALPETDVAGTQATLRTFFAPYDDPIKQELGLIREVIEAKKADPRTFPDGENPFSIKYAVYNLRNPDVIDALAEAHHAGVDVQILIEDHQLSPEKTWNQADEKLQAEGFAFSPTHKGLSDAQRQELDLIGIKGSGLMHLKTRMFSFPDPDTGEPVEKVATGSLNPGDSAPNNDETWHLITDPMLIDRYQAKYDSVLEGTKIDNVWKADAPVNVLFTPASGPSAADKILELVDNEQEAIFMSVFTLRNVKSKKHREGLVNKLKAAKERGVEVCIVTDRKMSDGDGTRWNDRTDEMLQEAGIPVYECTNESGPYNAMHAKSAVFGLSNPTVVSDCGNWTKAALGDHKRGAANDESYLFIDSEKLDGGATARRFLSNFLHLLRKYEHQQGPDTPPADQLIERFMAMPGWPKVKVDFDVVAKTYWGQDVYITGNHEALGNWTQEPGIGIKMNTIGGTYPLWSSDTSVELPFGLELEYKIVKRDAATGELDWQQGENQLLIVDSGDLRNDVDPGADTQRVSGKFRT